MRGPSFEASTLPRFSSTSEANALRDLLQPKVQHLALLEEHGFEGLLYPAIYLAWAQLIAGDIAGARRTSRQSIDLVRMIDDPYVTVGVLTFTAFLHHDLGDLVTAAELAAPAVPICQSKGFPAWLVLALVTVGKGKLAQGATEEAIAMIQEGLALCDSLGAKTPRAYYGSYLADAYMARGDPELAIEVLKQGLATVRVNVESYCEPALLRMLGEAYFARGEREAARDSLLSARALARSQGALLFELKARISLARLFGTNHERADAERAQDRLKSALGSDATSSPVDHVEPLLTALGE